MDYLNPCNKNQTAKVLERFFYVSNGREYISVIPDEAERITKLPTLDEVKEDTNRVVTYAEEIILNADKYKDMDIEESVLKQYACDIDPLLDKIIAINIADILSQNNKPQNKEQLKNVWVGSLEELKKDFIQGFEEDDSLLLPQNSVGGIDISKLEIGMTVKNYKMLCELLGQEVKSGKSKKYQLEDFARYFEWEKSGQKFIISDIRENAIYEKQISLFQEQIYVKETAMLNDKMVRDKFYHQLSFIKELVYQRELSQLNEFIDGIMQNKKIEKDGPANSGNVLLDYIVNNKCEIAVKQGIECTVKIEVPYKFPFSDGDIFIILGNALDNAIEGALKCVSRRYIHIKIIYRKENLFIKISNSFDGKVKKDRHGHLISMKSDLTRYGLGLALIEKSVNKYNGLLNFDIDEENFTLTVLLYS